MMQRSSLVLVALFTLLVCVLPARAQSHLDPGTLIDGLARRNMSDLLGHLIETEPRNDPVVNLQIEIARLTMRADDPALSRAERVDAVDQMIAVTRQLIADHPDHEQRPVWQTDLADRYFNAKLQFAGIYAAEFHEFGVLTAEQKEAIDSLAADVFVELAQADVRFRQLEDALARHAERRRELDNSGQWERMFEHYWRNSTQYYLALAAYHTALLDDSHPYFQNLGNPRVPLQRQNISDERKRLFDLAARSLEPLVSRDNQNITQDVRLLCLSLMGRALAQNNRFDEAMEAFREVVDARQTNMTDLLTGLGRALALHRNGQTGSAEELLLSLDKHAWAATNPALRLLVKDQLHRVYMDVAAKAPQSQRANAIAEAYEPYFDLLTDMRRQNDPELTNTAGFLENYIYSRWQAHLDPSVSHDSLPPAVVMGIGTAARAEGEQLAKLAMDALQQGQASRSAQLERDARAKLQQAIEMLDPLLQRDALLPAVKARAMFNLGLATYWLDPTDVDGVLQAARTWINLATELPEQPESETGIEFAVKELARVYFVAPGTEGYGSAFNQALEVLFDKFPTTQFADDFRLSYVTQVLMPADRYEEAARIAAGVPFLHVNYFEARREMLYSLLEAYLRTPEGNAKAEARRAVVTAGEALLEEAEAQLEGFSAEQLAQAVASLMDSEGDDDLRRRGTAFNTAGHTRLVLAQMAEADLEIDKALDLLKDFETRFAADRALAIEGFSRRISVYIAANRIDDAGREAQRMMDLYPEDAGGTVNNVVNSLERQIDQLRRQANVELSERRKRELTTRAEAMSKVLVTLSENLVDWALRQQYNSEEMVPFRLVYVKALCLSGDGEGAVKAIEPLIKEYASDATVIHYAGEALYTRGMANNNQQDLITAVTRYFDTLINGLQNQTDAQGKYSELFWHAWMRRLQVMDKLNQGVADIPVRVNGLEGMDPGLGGEPYRSTLRTLREKHRR